MGKGYKHGGANPLNFTVKTYPSEVELKADKPKENTIGVITTTTMTSWVFSATEPTEPEVGMVWFSIGTHSIVEFNALNKNDLQVYPLSAKQYVSGAWVDVTAWSYQGGEWVEWVTYLYVSGDECEELTGGWVTLGKSVSYSNNQNVAPAVTKGKDSMTITSGSTYTGGMVYTKNKIQISGKSKIVLDSKITYIDSEESAKLALRVWSDIGTYHDTNTVAALYLNKKEIDGLLYLDVSTLDGMYYVGFSLHSNAGQNIIVRSVGLK